MGTIQHDSGHSRASADKHTLHILVVDDCPDNRDSLALLVRCLGYDVQTAPDGSTALRMAQENPPDVVLLDIGMPEMSGYEVARRLRAVANPIRPLLVAVTGYASQRDRVLCEEAGIDLHLAKPVELDVLSHVLARFLRVLDPAPAEVA
jgi:two-component system CheB/CheR fusion protein